MPPPRGRRQDVAKNTHRIGESNDTTLRHTAVSRARELLDRRGAHRANRDGAGVGNGPSPTQRRRGGVGAVSRPTSRTRGGTSRFLEKPKNTAKNKAAAHNAAVLAEASLVADSRTNREKANAGTAKKRAPLGPCGATAVAASETVRRANEAAVEAGGAPRRESDPDAIQLLSSDSDDQDATNADAMREDEWEDVVFDGGSDVAEEDEPRSCEPREFSDGGGDVGEKKTDDDGARPPRRRVRRIASSARAALRHVHKTHLLCLLARASATDRAASDPLVRAMVVSATPRTLFDSREDGRAGKENENENDYDYENARVPTVSRVAQLAKWFAGAFACASTIVAGPGAFGAFGAPQAGGGEPRTRNSSGDAKGTRKESNRSRTVAHLDRIEATNDVIVLDDDGDDGGDDDDENDDENEVVGSGRRVVARRTDEAFKKSAVLEAVASAAVGPRVRLAFACARRRGTQEDTSALFVALARGFGYVARLVTALDSVPYAAPVPVLEKLGVLGTRVSRLGETGNEPGSSAAAFGSSVISENTENAEGFEGTEGTERTGSKALSRERLTHWVEVLCSDSGSSDGSGSRWIAVVPHVAGLAASRTRWRFQNGTASVDDPSAIRVLLHSGKGLSGGVSECAPYVAAVTASYAGSVSERGGVGAAAFKDVTRKYAETFSRCLRRRCEPAWVAETFGVRVSRAATRFPDARARAVSREPAWIRAAAVADAEETKSMESRQNLERVPSTLAELKNHPLYVSERFLKPTQAVYPRKPVVGFVDGECVFPRSCVTELRSAERWKTEARREVLPDALASPAAKAHSRKSRAAAAFAAARHRMENSAERSRKRKRADDASSPALDDFHGNLDPTSTSIPPRAAPLDPATGDISLFGIWQTREWDPPRARNGVIPINDRGNVELLGKNAIPPPGCAHVSLPRVARVARELRETSAASGAPRFDFASALVGFEYQRGGKTVPKFDGVVVCVEWEGRLRDAWRESERARVRGEREKERRRAKRRWRVLLSAVWTRVALREEFLSTPEGVGEGVGVGFDVDEGVDEGARHARGSKEHESNALCPLAGPATALRVGRVAVVRGGAEAEVEEM